MNDESLQNGSFERSPIGIAIGSQTRLLENIIADEIMQENSRQTPEEKLLQQKLVFQKEKERAQAEMESWEAEKEMERRMQREKSEELYHIHSHAIQKRRVNHELDINYIPRNREAEYMYRHHRNQSDIERIDQLGYIRGMEDGYGDMRRPHFQGMQDGYDMRRPHFQGMQHGYDMRGPHFQGMQDGYDMRGLL